jgi:glycosyltransferase involved in cell wall biosynthesis
VKRVLFYPLVFLYYLFLRKNKYDVVHHMFPLSLATFNPVIPFIKFIDKGTKSVLGPLQLPQIAGSKNEIGVVLTGKSSRNLSTFLITWIYWLLMKITKPFSTSMFKQANVVICNSQTAKIYYEKTLGLKNTVYIPTGISCKSENVLKRNNENLNILCVGQLSERKGQIYLLKAFKKLSTKFSNVNLFLVGDGPMREHYKEFVKSNQLEERVKFIGWVTPEDVEYYYKSSDIFCLPSISDPSPTVLLEAMMYALPIVAFDVGSVREMTLGAGIVVQSKDTEAFEHALETLSLDQNLRIGYGELGHRKVVDNYSWEAIVTEYLSLYKRL